MKLTSLPAATDLVARREKLQAMIDAVSIPLVEVQIGQSRAPESIVARCCPSILAECEAQMAQIDRELEALGIEVD